MQTYLVVSALANMISTLFLGVIVFVRGKKLKVNKSFLYIAVSVFVWSAGYYFWRQAQDYDHALFWTRVLMLGAIFIAPANLWFLAVFLAKEYQWRWLIRVSLAVSIFFALFSFSPLFVSHLRSTINLGLWPVPGPLYSPFLVLWLALTILSCVFLIKAYIKEQDTLKRAQLRYIIIGLVAALVGGYTNFLPWYRIDILPVGNILSTFYMAAIALAVLKYGLLNVKVIATEIIVAALVLVSLIDIVLSQSLSGIILRSFISAILIIFSILLVRSVNAEVAQREQLQKLTSQLRQINSDLILRNRYLAALQSLTNEITRSLDFKKFSQEIVDGVAEKLGFAGAILLTLNKDGETIELATMTNNRLFKKAVSLLPNAATSYTGNFKKDNTLTILAMRTGRVQIGSDLHSFISPPVPKGIALVIQNLLRIRSIMAVPIFSDNKVLGCLLVGSRSSKEQTANTEIQMVKALADEVGIVARNLILYERLEEANTKLKAANEQLERLDRAKTEFLSIASHQLRTPLTAIKGYVSMILEGDYGKIPEKFKEPLNDVFKSAERLIALVNDLLDVSRIASGRMELHIQPVDLDKLTRDVIEEIMPKAEAKKISLVLNNKMVKEALVRADPEKLRQVVINLIDNAIKYTEKGQVTITFEGTNSYIRFSVKDNGIGISAEELPQLFHKFMRTPEAKLVEAEGTGLGLYVAKTVIESMGGRIWAESEGLGKGSTFIFELPVAIKDLGEEIIKVDSKSDYA